MTDQHPDQLAIEAVKHFTRHAPSEWWLHVQPTVEGVSCPMEWAAKPVLAVKLNVEVPEITDHGLRVALLHRGVWTPCFFPWASIGAVTDNHGAGLKRAQLESGQITWLPYLTQTDGPLFPREGDGISAEERFIWAVSTPAERRRMFLRVIPGGLASAVSSTPTPESPQYA